MDGGLVMWDVMLKRPRAYIDAHRHSIDGVVVSPDGVACFSASRDKTVKMWDLDVSSAGSEQNIEPLA